MKVKGFEDYKKEAEATGKPIYIEGVELKIDFNTMSSELKNGIRRLCEKYKVKPECIFPVGGGCEIIRFWFGEEYENKYNFMHEMGAQLNIKLETGHSRYTYGCKTECPIGLNE